MRTHLISVHQQDSAKCDICGKEYPYESYLEKHYVKCQQKQNKKWNVYQTYQLEGLKIDSKFQMDNYLKYYSFKNHP